MSADAILGIDFGSHTSCICLWSGGRAEVIANELGNRDTVCCVAFLEGGEILCGDSARNQIHKNKENSFADLRKLVETSSALEACESEESSSSTVYVPVLERHMPIEELLSLYFRTLHDTVAQYYGKRVRDCALGVPTRFTQASIDLMVEAAKQGGLRVKTTIVEPVAVALAHGIDDTETFDSSQPKYVLVFDLGWSSADVTLLRVVQGLIAVESSLQETQVSGQGFVDALVDLCVKEFKRKSRLDCTESLRAMMRLRRACEDSMKILSTSPQSNVDIDSLYEGCDFSYCITRARFEDVAASVFPLINTALSSALENAGLEASDVSLIICGGAVSKIPRVQQILQGRFPDARNGVLPVDAEETVAMGAALHAHYLVAANAMNVIETLSSETRTLSVCVGVIPGPEGSDAEFVSILPEGSVLPVSANVSAVLASGPEESAVFQVVTRAPGQQDLVLAEITFDCSSSDVNDDHGAVIDIIYSAASSGELKIVVNGRRGGSVVEFCSHTVPLVSDV